MDELIATLRAAHACILIAASDWESAEAATRLKLHRCERRVAKVLARFSTPSRQR